MAPVMRCAAAFAFAVVTVSGCAGVAPRPRPLSTHGEIVHATLSSESLGVDKDVTVWLPRRYGIGAARYAVIVLLHGVGGDETDFERMEIASRADEIDLGAILVMPDGDDGYWADWAAPLPFEECMAELPPWRRPEPGRPPPEELAHFCVRQQRYESYVVHDLLDWVDATYRTRPGRNARGIGGLSMGGLGALSIAMRHPDVFSVAVSHSGAVSLLYAGPHPFEPGRAQILDDLSAWGRGREERVPGMPAWVRRIYGPDLEGWRAHDPASLGASLEDGALALSFDAGDADWLGYADQARHLAEVLTAAGVRHEVAIVPGGDHDDRYFATRLDDALAFFAAHLAGVDPLSSGGRSHGLVDVVEGAWAPVAGLHRGLRGGR